MYGSEFRDVGAVLCTIGDALHMNQRPRQTLSFANPADTLASLLH